MWRPLMPAAFRRLCVETFNCLGYFGGFNQPPSGGCVLKRRRLFKAFF